MGVDAVHRGVGDLRLIFALLIADFEEELLFSLAVDCLGGARTARKNVTV